MESGAISDSQITEQTPNTTTKHARLYSQSSWCISSTTDLYLQVDLGRVKTVTGVATQGDPSSDKWVKKYFVSYRYVSSSWYWYKLRQEEDTSRKVCGKRIHGMLSCKVNPFSGSNFFQFPLPPPTPPPPPPPIRRFFTFPCRADYQEWLLA